MDALKNQILHIVGYEQKAISAHEVHQELVKRGGFSHYTEDEVSQAMESLEVEGVLEQPKLYMRA